MRRAPQTGEAKLTRGVACKREEGQLERVVVVDRGKLASFGSTPATVICCLLAVLPVLYGRAVRSRIGVREIRGGTESLVIV
jgi:hypothetical protein